MMVRWRIYKIIQMFNERVTRVKHIKILEGVPWLKI